MTLKDHAKLGAKLNPAFQICLKKICHLFPPDEKGSKFYILLFSLVWKVNCLNQKTFTGVLFCDAEGPCKLSATTESCFPTKHKKNWQFVSSGQKGSKFQNLLLWFLRKVNCLNQKTFTWVFFCATEGPWKVWAKTESCFPNQSEKACSICFQWAKPFQLSYFIALFCVKGKFLQPKPFTGVLFCNTEGPWKVWANTESCFPNQPKTN